MTLARITRRAGMVALCGLGCAGRASAPAPTSASSPAVVPSSPGSARASDEAHGVALAPETFPLAAEPTWPDQTYGSDAFLPPLPASCGVIAKRPRVACAAGDQPLLALAEAAGSKPALLRDERLWALEACADFPVGFIRQLRADLFIECAPTIADLEADESSKLPAEARATLHALVFAHRLERFGESASKPLVAKVTREVAGEYLTRYLEPWLNERVPWLRLQEAVPARFAKGSYARALALFALAKAWATLKGATAARPFPVDHDLARDYELRTRFYGEVDEATEELKAAGTAISQQALDAIAWQGMTRPPFGAAWLRAAVSPAARSRTQPSPLFRLLLPRLELAERPTPLQQLFERLPPYYSVELVPADDLTDRATLASLLVQGLAPEARQRLMASGQPDQLWALAQLRARLGILTHQRQQFEWAAEHLRRLGEIGDGEGRAAALHYQDDAVFLAALVDTLRQGPRQAASWQDHPLPVFATASLASLVRVAESGPTALHRALARANLGELAWAGAAPMSQLQQGFQDLSEAHRQLEGTPFANCVAESMDEKRDTGPFRVSPCASYRARKPQVPERLYFRSCGPLGWQNQRRLETPATLDALCGG